MRALLIKDLYTLKSTIKMLGAFLVMMILVTILNKDPSFMSSYTIVLSAMLPVTCMGLDERAKWDRYALTMPLSRRDLVLSKYMLGLLLVLCTTALTLGLMAITGWQGQDSLAQALMFPAMGLLLMAITMPLSLRFGVEKGRILLIMLVAILVGGFIALAQTELFARLIQAIGSAGSLLAVVLVTLLVYALSALIALAIYRKKEFS